MLTMIYKPGGKTKVWGLLAEVKTIDSSDLNEYLDDGWLDHPSKLLNPPEPEPEPVQRKKPGPKPKADKDVDSD